MRNLKSTSKRLFYFNAVILTTFTLINACRTSVKITEKIATDSTHKKTKISGTKNLKQHSRNDTSGQIYHLHKKIKTTYFYIGEKDIYKSGVIDNGSSAWTKDWVKAYGGIDYPDKRNGYFPSGFIPKENPFYFALPYNDVTNHGHKTSINNILILKKWKEQADSRGNDDFVSYCKNKWIKIIYKDKICYAQWEDVGPFETDDIAYVFGNSRPKNRKNGGVGLDISPACFKYLGMKDNDYTDWQFVDFSNVPDGPWLRYITISNPRW